MLHEADQICVQLVQEPVSLQFYIAHYKRVAKSRAENLVAPQ